MRKIIVALAVMAMTLSVSAQTKKTASSKKTTTTATTKKSTTGTTKKSTTSTAKKSTTSTAKKSTTGTAKKSTTGTAKKSTTSSTANKSTSTTAPKQPTTQKPATAAYKTSEKPKSSKSVSSQGNKGWNEVYHNIGTSFIGAKEVHTRTPYEGSSYSGDGGNEYSCTGNTFKFTVGYNHAFPLSQSMPLYLRAGASLDLETGSKNLKDMYNTEGDANLSANMFSTNINVDCGYKIPIGDGSKSIMPYAGADFKLNIAGNATEDNHTYNIFNDKDMDLDGNAISRVQGGFHVGADMFLIRHLVLGLSFQYYTPLLNAKSSRDDDYWKYRNDYQSKISQCSLVLKAGFVW